MKIVPFEKLQQNLDYYLLLCHKEDIYVVKDHKIVSRLVNPKKERMKTSRNSKAALLINMMEQIIKRQSEKKY